MNIILIYSLLAFALHPTLCNLTECQCNQIQSEFDCTSSKYHKNCYWNSTSNTCQQSSQQLIIPAYDFYCDQFNSSSCSQTIGCAWWDQKCVFFTDCTAYAKKTHEDCQEISKLCITDGQHCVQKTTCKNYTISTPCVQDIMGKYCYWDKDQCTDAQTCDQLPKSLNSDSQCREAISTCTAKPEGGCQESGNNCADQTSTYSCVSNKNRSQACFWNNEVCVDKICSNAPITYQTDQACKNFLNGCTTKLGGGCVARLTCQAAQVQAACIKNNTGALCYWNGTACVDYICTNAPSSYSTNKLCQAFKAGCITTGQGCKENGLCSAATVEVACDKNSSGNPCIWNTVCKDKTCVNAPLSNNTHELCQSYLYTCTVSSLGIGCVDKTCDNALIFLQSNEECENYLPNNDCVTKAGGGCMKNTFCAGLSKNGCVKDISGNQCFWDTTCKDRTCTNAPILTTHQECQIFSTKCTVNQSGSGCVYMFCENILTEDICKKDFNGNYCIFKQKCYMKQCVFSSKSITTHADCQDYLSSCTLSNSGAGCVQLPLKCEAITIQAACYYKQTPTGLAKCGWNGTQCIDYDCTTIDKTVTTSAACNSILDGCVSANPVNNVVSGCMALPFECSQRLTADNCEIEGVFQCIWSSMVCIQKTCFTASLPETNGYLVEFTSNNCNQYLSECISNNTKDGCMPPVFNCDELETVDNCQASNCFWISSTCVEKKCQNVPLHTFQDCNAISSSCTVNSTYTNCQDLADCTTYITASQCQINLYHEKCYWTGSSCRDQMCTDAPSTQQYQTALSCENFQVGFDVCTVISKVANQGCVTKQYKCEEYLEQIQCVTDLQNNQCVWQNNQCQSQICHTIQLDTYNTANCENQLYMCKANLQNSACQYKDCEDYNTTNGLSSGVVVNSDTDCQTLDSKCTIDYTAGDVKCQTKQYFCNLYTTQAKCTFANEGACVWSGMQCVLSATFCSQFRGADDATCSAFRPFCNQTTPGAVETSQCTSHVCADKTGSGLTNSDCQVYDSTCVVNSDGSACVANNTVDCSNFQGDSDPSCERFRPFCRVRIAGVFDNCTSKACADKTGSGLTNADCQAFDSTCVVNSDETACVANNTVDCSNFSGATDAVCFGFRPFCKVRIDGTLGQCTTHSCSDRTGSSLTQEICQSYDLSCSVNRDGTSCQTKEFLCTDYSLENCTTAQENECVGTSDSGTCVAVTSSIPCNQIYLGYGNYTHELCQKKNSSCTNIVGEMSCQAKTCQNAPSSTSISDCNNWLSSCTWNGLSACVSITYYCYQQPSIACYKAIEGNCIAIGSQCQRRTCDNAPPTLNTHAQCNEFLSECTVARTGGCISRQNCESYSTELQCQKDYLGFECYWSDAYQKCSYLACSSIDQTSNYGTHKKCNNKLSTCTVRSYNGVPQYGCQPLTSCSSYSIQEQCHINFDYQPCEWDTNFYIPICVDKSCTTAPSSISTHADCQTYYGTNACTVAAVAGTNGGANILGGCIPVGLCSSYIDEEQCHINALGGQCGWNGTVCADFACSTSPQSNNSDALCQTYKAGCTLDQSGSGCMSLLQNCEDYQIEGNCIINLSGSQCFWDSTTNKCITRTCENAPDFIVASTDCETYLSGCTSDSVKCKTKICEDYKFSTDYQCRAAHVICTTDGTQCVKRGSCLQALSKLGCVTDVEGNKCQWISATENSQAYCTIRSCSTAPIEHYKTESQCVEYMAHCTTRLNGGCIAKTTCAAADIDLACTKALDGTKCQWDTITKSCRNKECQDYTGFTHATCQAINSACTVGLNGHCASINSCSSTKVRAACISGTDGPCLWITDSKGVGACYPYTSCQSLAWTTDSECKSISPKCTTNGIHCLGITLCGETNVNGGCVTGNDGDCIQTQVSSQTKTQVCNTFSRCSDAYYITHSECQTASYKCTTDGKTGCIPLEPCHKYTQSGCYITAEGQVTQNGLIKSTGICIWDKDSQSCGEQTCSDLVGATHLACLAQLSSCTSDGTNCLIQSTCSTYTQAACKIAQGTDGVCIWQAVTATIQTAACRLIRCDDVQNGVSTQVCEAGLSGCVSNGTACIAKANCSTYTTQTACNSGGLDGICVFTANGATGTCALMTSCSQASNDFNACFAAKDRCAYFLDNIISLDISPGCHEYTCQSYQLQNINCNGFLNWDKTIYRQCQFKDSQCIEIDPGTLDQHACYLTTNFYYTWNMKDQKCVACQVNPSNGGNNNQSTSFSWKKLGLSVISILIYHFMF